MKKYTMSISLRNTGVDKNNLFVPHDHIIVSVFARDWIHAKNIVNEIHPDAYNHFPATTEPTQICSLIGHIKINKARLSKI